MNLKEMLLKALEEEKKKHLQQWCGNKNVSKCVLANFSHAFYFHKKLSIQELNQKKS